MFVPSVILYFCASGANAKAGCILSHFTGTELQRPHDTSITSAAAQVGLQTLMDVHKVTRSKRHIHNLVHRCAMELFRFETKWCEQQWEYFITDLTFWVECSDPTFAVIDWSPSSSVLKSNYLRQSEVTTFKCSPQLLGGP